MSVPQTVGFEVRLQFDHPERTGPRTLDLVFHDFHKMEQRWYTERHRRKRSERPTSGQYRMFLTAHGKQAVAADPDVAARHADVDGHWSDL